MKKILHAVTGEQCPDEIYDRCAAAANRFGPVIDGYEIIYPVKLHYNYLPVTGVVRAYRRVEASHVSMGCCGGDLEEQRLVLVTAGNDRVFVPYSRRESVELAIEELKKLVPGLAVGFDGTAAKG